MGCTGTVAGIRCAHTGPRKRVPAVPTSFTGTLLSPLLWLVCKPELEGTNCLAELNSCTMHMRLGFPMEVDSRGGCPDRVETVANGVRGLAHSAHADAERLLSGKLAAVCTARAGGCERRKSQHGIWTTADRNISIVTHSLCVPAIDASKTLRLLGRAPNPFQRTPWCQQSWECFS